MRNYVVFWTILHFLFAKQMPPTDWDVRANWKQPEQINLSNQLERPHNQFDRFPGKSVEEPRFVNKDCLDGIRHCEIQNGICRVDLEIFKQFCGDWQNERSLLGCNRKVVKECRSALRTVNDGRLGLRHCTCDSKSSRSIDDLSKCNLLRRNLNSHPCLHEPPLLFREGSDSWHHLSTFEQNQFPNKNHQISAAPTRPIQKSREMTGVTKTQESSSGIVINDTDNELVTTTLELDPLFNQPDQTSPNVTIRQAENNAARSEQNASIAGDILLTTRYSKQTSCLDLLENCTSQISCAKSLNRFRALCTPRSCEKLRSHCIQAYKEFQSHGATKNCSCKSETELNRKQRCLDYEMRILQNACVDYEMVEFMDYQVADNNHESLNFANHMSSVVEATNTTDLKKMTSTHQNSATEQNAFVDKSLEIPETLTYESRQPDHINCYEVYISCIREPKCLSYYLRLAQFCSPWSACEPTDRCKEITKNFYSSINDSLTSQALECSCSLDDSECKQQQSIFRPECSTVPKTQTMPCSSIWARCREDSTCDAALSFLIDGCYWQSTVCQLNATKCLTAHRQLWLHSLVTQCRCDVVSLDFRHHQATDNEYSTYPCDAFQRLLTQSPCEDRDGMQTNINEGIKINHLTPACRIANTLHLSPETIVRVYPKTEDMNHLLDSQQQTQQPQPQQQQVCSQLCGCTNGCLHHLCFPETQPQQQTAERLLSHNPMQLTTGQQTGRQQQQATTTRITPFTVCHYLPLADPQCACLSDGDVHCRRNINHARLLKSVQLQITYARDEFSTILGLLDQTASTNEFQYYVRLLDMASLLESVLTNATGNKNCGLLLARHHIPQKRTEFAAHPMMREGIPVEETRGQLTYFIVSTTRTLLDRYEQEAIESETDEVCLQTIQLLELMINQRFPRILYHPLLSVLKNATLVHRSLHFPKSMNNSNRTKVNRMESSSYLPVDQQSAWRKPRTSHKKRLEPIAATQSQGTCQKCDRILIKLIPGLLFLILIRGRFCI